MVKELKPWCMCQRCGDKKYPKADHRKMVGITVHMGYCEVCKSKKQKMLVPVSDYEFASGDNSKWD